MEHRVRRVRVDRLVAEHFLSYEKQPEVGVEDTNRKWSEIVVNGYAFEMLAGRWRETHQGMAFMGYIDDGTGIFADGGQRCRAIIAASTIGAKLGDVELPPNPEIAFWFTVTEGMTQEEIDAVDIGKRRTPGDFAQMAGWAFKNAAASAARLCYLYENVPWSPEAWRKHPVTPGMIKKYLRENPGLREAILQGSRVSKQMIISSAIAGYHLGVKEDVSEELLSEFIDHLQSGANMDKGNPILTLREMLRKTNAKRRKWTREEQLALFIKAFNKWVTDTEVSMLSFKTIGPTPDFFPRFVKK